MIIYPSLLVAVTKEQSTILEIVMLTFIGTVAFTACVICCLACLISKCQAALDARAARRLRLPINQVLPFPAHAVLDIKPQQYQAQTSVSNYSTFFARE